MAGSDKKVIRKEFRKTIMFKNEEDKELFTKIIENESEAKGVSPSEFLVEHVKNSFLPTNKDANRFAKWMYKGYKVDDKTGKHIKMNAYDVLSDIFGFIAGKVEINGKIGNNMALVYIMASFLRDSELSIEKTGDKYAKLKNELTNISNFFNGAHTAEAFRIQNAIFELTRNDISSFAVKNFLDLVIEYYENLKRYKSYYLSLSYFCRIISTLIHQNPDNYLDVIKILTPLSYHWDIQPKPRNK